jgi:hypothetical protein
VRAVDASDALDEAVRGVAEAEHELDLFITNPSSCPSSARAKSLEGVDARQGALDDARETLAELRNQSTLADELAEGDLLKAWPTPTIQDRGAPPRPSRPRRREPADEAGTRTP